LAAKVTYLTGVLFGPLVFIREWRNSLNLLQNCSLCERSYSIYFCSRWWISLLPQYTKTIRRKECKITYL